MIEQDKRALRVRDFWTALLLMALSLFMLWRTSLLPFFKASAAGVSAEWFNSAALVPYGVFGVLFLLSVALLAIAVRDGGLPGRGTLPAARDMQRVAAIAVILFLYIFCLVPRVDFTLASALVILALIYGFHDGRDRPTRIALLAVAVPALYAAVANFPQAEWTAPKDDDWVTLVAFLVLSVVAPAETRATTGRLPRWVMAAPVIGLIVPFLLVAAMAFGFRQNVPNRTGLIFSKVEYHYYVTVRPWLRGE